MLLQEIQDQLAYTKDELNEWDTIVDQRKAEVPELERKARPQAALRARARAALMRTPGLAARSKRRWRRRCRCLRSWTARRTA